ncbi:uncharacterized protein Z518_01334 [Rhinocladiella mackenziei CBS 650.93]|uniref:RTA1 domain protein n=1 Tax=Rhinocladiella mackenziei CBS 650.93 TaxID=1442369 RepID=A0A0D2HHT7_9EURO|nr:uncharacterized protein Z518_01334 [Rhinocladiella mackenziei CBS 650.93]KIX10253.1 hypothetical protein Z518_01334 [Rhinocladiella mackenziei CBS 650.93]
MIFRPADDPLAHVVALATRALDSGPADKTPEEWATEGRYNYAPSFAAAVVFIALYGIALAINLFQMFRHRAWFWWVMNFAIILEFVGYLSRAISIKNLDERGPFIVQTVLILVAPAVMAAACYMAFGRVVLWVVPVRFQSARHLWVPARRLTPVFVGFDVLSFVVQTIGGAMIAGSNDQENIERGRDVVLAGLGLQLFTFGFFVIASFRLFVMLRTTLRDVALTKERNWQLFLMVINVANVFILIRTILRLIEYSLGTSNYLLNNEWFFYVFDSSMMYIVVIIFIIFHPGHFLPFLGIRRKAMQFSKNADKGPFGKLARGSVDMEAA